MAVADEPDELDELMDGATGAASGGSSAVAPSLVAPGEDCLLARRGGGIRLVRQRLIMTATTHSTRIRPHNTTGDGRWPLPVADTLFTAGAGTVAVMPGSEAARDNARSSVVAAAAGVVALAEGAGAAVRVATVLGVAFTFGVGLVAGVGVTDDAARRMVKV